MKKRNNYNYRNFTIPCLILSLIICLQITMQADVKKYDKYGIIIGNKNYLRRTPNGVTIKGLKEGEVVVILKKENKDDWYKITTLDSKTGWVKKESIYYLDKNKKPEEYYIKVLGRLDKIFTYQKNYSLFNVKFEYLKDQNIIVYRFSEIDPPTYRDSLELYEIKDREVRMVTSSHKYDSNVFIDNKYAFIVSDRNMILSHSVL